MQWQTYTKTKKRYSFRAVSFFMERKAFGEESKGSGALLPMGEACEKIQFRRKVFHRKDSRVWGGGSPNRRRAGDLQLTHKFRLPIGYRLRLCLLERHLFLDSQKVGKKEVRGKSHASLRSLNVRFSPNNPFSSCRKFLESTWLLFRSLKCSALRAPQPLALRPATFDRLLYSISFFVAESKSFATKTELGAQPR